MQSKKPTEKQRIYDLELKVKRLLRICQKQQDEINKLKRQYNGLREDIVDHWWEMY